MKSVFSTILTTLCLFLAGVLSYAQNTISVSGTVKDGSGAPVIGASVMQKGATVGAATDVDGKYNISVPSNAILEFSCIGMTTQEVNVNGRTVINVVLTDDSNILESVVVVGYGTQKRGSLTGAVAGINSGELMKTKTENPQNMLTGRVPGVRVWQTSAEPGTYSANMDIRGLGSPLVVIDGVPRTVSDFQRLTPEDIENVSVLKDASAAIYGVRGANGVILVSTKHGQAGKSKVSYNGSYTIQTPSKMPELMNAFDAMTIYNEKSMNSMTGGNIEKKNSFILERGMYLLAAVLDESVSPEPLKLDGRYVDLYDPSLPICENVEVRPGVQRLFIDLSKVRKDSPMILAAASRAENETLSGRTFSYVAKSPAATVNVSRVLLPAAPKSLKVNDKECLDLNCWDETSQTYLLTFDNNPDGVAVEFAW